MNKRLKATLRSLYQDLKDAYIDNHGSQPDGSLFQQFFKKKKNDRRSILRESGRKRSSFGSSVFAQLTAKNYLRPTDQLNEYCLTAEGLWAIETDQGLLSQDDFLNFVDKRRFALFDKANKSFRDRDKVVLLGLIAARAFSSQSKADLKYSEDVEDHWQDIFRRVAAFLDDAGAIENSDDEDVFGTSKTEHPASNLLRHTDQLSGPSKGIFQSGGRRTYYLDLYEDGLMTDQLRFLLRKIFDNTSLSPSERDELKTLLQNIHHDKAVHLYDTSDHTFDRLSIEEQIDSVVQSI